MITRVDAALQQRSLEITERLFRSGNDSELDVQQARTQLPEPTLATIPDLKRHCSPGADALCVSVARPPGALPKLSSRTRENPDAPLDVIVDLPAEMLRRRPDVRAAELQRPPSRRRSASARRTLSVDALAGSLAAVDHVVRLAHRHPRWGSGRH